MGEKMDYFSILILRGLPLTSICENCTFSKCSLHTGKYLILGNEVVGGGESEGTEGGDGSEPTHAPVHYPLSRRPELWRIVMMLPLK